MISILFRTRSAWVTSVLVLLLSACGGGGGGGKDGGGNLPPGGGTDTSYQVTLSASPVAGGLTFGGGSYLSGASATAMATPASGYTFSHWSEGGNQVSTSASYAFSVTSARTLVAHFNNGTGGGGASGYTVGGNVSGLTGSVMLQNNGGDTLTVSANGNFAFSTPIAEGGSYEVSIFSQPSGQSCTLSQGSGSVGTSNVTNVSLVCSTAVVKSCADYDSSGQSPVVQSEAYATLYNFTYDSSVWVNSPTGRRPENTLVEGPDGNFYGVTYYGGENSTGYNANGVIFRMTPAGDVSVMHTFYFMPEAGLHGINPYAGLTLGSDCHLYGTTRSAYGGDPSPSGAVFRMSLEGDLTYLAPLNIVETGSDQSYPLTLGSDGNFYGVMSRGGAYNSQRTHTGTVFKMTHAGEITLLHSFDQTNGGTPNGPLVEGEDGNFYGVTRSGGAHSNGTVFRITPQGEHTVLKAFDQASGYWAEGGLVVGPEGHLYGTAMYSGPNNAGTVFKITPAGEFSLVHSFKVVEDGMVCNCGLSTPSGALVLADDGHFYGIAWGGSSGPYMHFGGAVFKMSVEGEVSVVTYFPAGGASSSYGIIQGSDGHFYGTSYSGGTDSVGTLFRILKP
ncbi:choice-of-anchor tandem repeat GloVer-containing protein [Marinimicrobium sp. ABcell2]|uniref:choice-of-anchor tandem repeat GloVer-containing protein n=1 Tax=Marinimicrobium sp. ABcell2 TaxID=3069751 RepID=UPI0027B3C8F1|nr:choice-of-anchor tandem repeat GloVer-containing protein [Marinimicrobium sp. ABcell2]MDQ2077817.1 hypothetical protein [Marinimicrobium sp. ABcell2]